VENKDGVMTKPGIAQTKENKDFLEFEVLRGNNKI
jgi:hypothetical protein